MMISADSHFLDPPHLWSRWLAAKYHDRAPKLVEDGDGGQGWLFAGARKPEPIGLAGLPGRPAEDLRPSGVRFDEIRPGTYDGAARLLDQDEDGVSAEVIFPTARPLGHFLDDPDRDLVLAGVEAYNRFVLEEFCAAAPGRLFPVAQLPTTGVDHCVRVLRDAAERGFVAAVLPSWPTGGDHLDAESAPFWGCAEELEMPICIHVGLRSREERLLWRELNEQQKEDLTESRDTVRLHGYGAGAPPAPLEFHHRSPNFGLSLGRGASVFSDLLLSGLFDAYPRLRVGLIEMWVGWIPRALEAVDDIWQRNRYLRQIPLQRPPSSYWHSNMTGSFMDDRMGVRARDVIGTTNMMWSTDYPHFGTLWPHSRALVDDAFADVSKEDRTAILSGNCIDFYRLADRLTIG